MATSGMSYAIHYDFSGRSQEGILQDISRMRIETAREPPVLYVAMATWIPKCNMYHQNCGPQSPATEDVVMVEKTDVQELIQTIVGDLPAEDVKIDEAEDEPKATASKQLEEKLSITPKKAMSPKQLQKKLESEKKRQQKQQEREERERKKHEERERLRLEKEKQKQEKDKQKEEQKQKKEKERELKEEQKRKEREEKEAKRKEKEEREEQKRKEREQDKLRKQQELEEKNKEKQKLEEQKQKAAAAFVNFFVAKKPEAKADEGKTSKFMPFEVKSDMKLAPQRRPLLTVQEKEILEEYLEKPNESASYLADLKNGATIGKCVKTWPYEEDVIIVEEDFGVSICEDEDKSKAQKMQMRAKFLKFHENRRPPYFGTWRKRSSTINPRKPFSEDKSFFDYEVDSDDDWEEEEQGESLSSDDEEKENEAENDDYEVDNEFFVPHGHLSDDEVDDEAISKLSPESQKQKLKLLKDEFDQDMQMKTSKMKPRSIGCIWYNKDGSNVDESIDRHLRPLSMLTNGQVIMKKRKDLINQMSTRKYAKELREELIPEFLKMIHGNVNRRTMVVDDFIKYMQNNEYTVEVSKTYLGRRMKQFAQWKKCTEKGPLLNKFCWCVEEEIKKKYNVDLYLK